MTETTQMPAQTPAQWAVRWHGVVAAAVLVAVVPLFHLTWHFGLGHDEPPIVTKSQIELPVATADDVLDGSWMETADRHLREASPVVWQLRGSWNELLYRGGVVQSSRVHRGKDEWLFNRWTLTTDVARLEGQRDARRRFLTGLRDAVRGAGAELVISLVPDKARVHPEFAYENGELDPRKAPIYDYMLAELKELGIPTANVLTMMQALRAGDPGEPLYYARDTHWRPRGALAAAQAVAAVIAPLPAARTLSPRRDAQLGAGRVAYAVGDLTSMLGLLTRQVSVLDRSRTVPMSLLTTSIAEERTSYSVFMLENGKQVPPLTEALDAEVTLIGTSFSEANGSHALALVLGRPIRAVTGLGASGFAGLYEIQDELRAGTQSRIVVWEIVERGLFEADWSALKF